MRANGLLSETAIVKPITVIDVQHHMNVRAAITYINDTVGDDTQPLFPTPRAPRPAEACGYARDRTHSPTWAWSNSVP